MHNNAGNKLVKLADFLGVIGIIASIVLGIAVISVSSSVIWGLLTFGLGFFLSWTLSLALYTIGETHIFLQKIEKTHRGEE